MKVNPKDGVCYRCRGALTVTDASEDSLTVECECGETYEVEIDAFGDGAMFYWPMVMAAKIERGME